MRPLILTTVVAGLLALFYQARSPQLLINLSESMPRGLYRREVPLDLKLEDVVEIRLTKEQLGSLGPRKWLNEEVTLLKRVVATKDSVFCVSGEHFYIDGTVYGLVRTEDSQGAKLPNQKGCKRLTENQYLVRGEGPLSFDSRYFGPVEGKNIVSKAKLLIGF